MSSWQVPSKDHEVQLARAFRDPKSSWHVPSEILKSSWHVPEEIIKFSWNVPVEIIHFFNAWNLKEASRESFVFPNQGCDLNVRIRTKPCVFSDKWSFRCREKLARVRDGCGRHRFAFDSCSFCARRGNDGSRWLFLFFDDAVLLCFLRCFVHWNCCIEEMRSCLELLECRKPRTTASISFLQLVEFEGSLARKLRFHESRMRCEC